MIRNLATALVVERLAARAWPAWSVEVAGGWLLRHTPEVTPRRSNSVLPLLRDGAPRPPDELASLHKLVEAFYARCGQPVLYQVSPLQAQQALDGFLDDRGYAVTGATAVLAAPVERVWRRTIPQIDLHVTIAPRPTHAWVDHWAEIGTRQETDAIVCRVLYRIRQPAVAGYALAWLEGCPVGVGMAVAEQGWAGIFCMATRLQARRRGVARGVLHNLAYWAVTRGAERLYLQVGEGNVPARTLYERAGFTCSHCYHHRRAPEDT